MKRKNKRPQEKNTASNKIQRFARNALKFETVVSEKSV